MDPLSISASVIATLQALSATIHGVRKLWKLRHAPRDLLLLQYELNDLKCLLLRVHQTLHADYDRDDAGTALIQQYTDRLRSHFQELEETASKLVQTHSASGTRNFPYYRWLRTGGRITTIRSNIVETRSNLSLAISTLLASQNGRLHRVLLHVQELEFTSEKGSDEQLPLSVGHELSESTHSTLLDIGTTTELATKRASTDSHQTSATLPLEAPTLENLSEDDLLCIKATAPTTSCDYICSCQCHIRTPLSTPRWLEDMCGYLFADHTALPWLGRRSCNTWTCKQNDGTAIRVTYILPGWLMRRAFVFSMKWKDLLGQGASWTVRIPRLIPFNTPIWSSIRYDAFDSVLELLRDSQFSPFDVRPDGTTFVHNAISHRRWDIVRMLLFEGAGLDFADESGRTTLSYALMIYQSSGPNSDDHGEAYSIIQNIDPEERLGFTPLHTAVLQKSPAKLSQYLAMDLTHLNARDNLGRTPLMLACSHASEEVVRTLLQFGADSTLTDRVMQNALHHSILQGNFSIVKALFNPKYLQPQSKDVALSLVEGRDLRGCTPCYSAIEHHHAEILAYILDHGARVDVKDNQHRTLLHYTAWTGGAPIMHVLSLQDLTNVDPDAVNQAGYSAEKIFKDYRKNCEPQLTEAFQNLLAVTRRSHRSNYDLSTREVDESMPSDQAPLLEKA